MRIYGLYKPDKGDNKGQTAVAWIRPCYNTFQLKVFHEQNSKVVVFYHESDVTMQHSQL